MAAYELRTQAPAMLQVPDSVNQGSRNLMQFMRSQQEQRNAQDRLALEKQNVENLKQFRAGKLNLDQQRTDNQLQDTTADNIRADNAQTWMQGAEERARTAAKNLNVALNDGYKNARGTLANAFDFTPDNMAALQQDERFMAMGKDEQAAFIDNARTQFQNDIPKHVGMQQYEMAIRNELAQTSATPEQIESQVQARLQSAFPEADPMNAQMMSLMARNMGINTSTGSRTKVPGLDDVGNIIDEQKYVQGWMENADVEKGNRTWFGKLLDVGGRDLNESNVATYISQMKQRGFNAVEALSALEVHRDADAVGAGFDQFIKGEMTDAFKPVIDAAVNARNLKARQSGSGGQGSADLMNLIASQNQPRGQASTELQRREILLGMLGQRLQAAQQSGNGNAGIDAETAKLIEDVAAMAPKEGETVGNPLATQMVDAAGQQPQSNDPSQFMQMLLGQNAVSGDAALDSINKNVFTPIGNAVGGRVFDRVQGFQNAYNQNGLLGVAGEIGPGNDLIDLIKSIGTPDTPAQQIQALEAELAMLHPSQRNVKRGAYIQKQIAELSKGL